MCKHETDRGASPPPTKLLEFRGYEIASETILGPKTMLLEGQTTEFHMHEYIYLFRHIVLASSF